MTSNELSIDPPLVGLVGPTAVGKTSLSLLLCRHFNGEIVGADSRQIYRLMDIGTAKPTADELAQAPHHLIDIRNPDETLTLAEYQGLAYAAIDQIHARHALPLLVGGTALYVRAVVEGLRIPQVPPDPALRRELEEFLAAEGRDALYARLMEVDPATAAVIDGQNPRRVLRALEIFLLTGKPKVALEGKKKPPYRILLLGLTCDRATLYDRIDRRVDAMMAQGLVAETEELLARGFDPRLPAMSSLGYREIRAYLQGLFSLDQAVAKIKTETHRYVRHQETWFRKMASIHWLQAGPDAADMAIRAVQHFIDAAK